MEQRTFAKNNFNPTDGSTKKINKNGIRIVQLPVSAAVSCTINM
jgi:hypothetical protein